MAIAIVIVIAIAIVIVIAIAIAIVIAIAIALSASSIALLCVPCQRSKLIGVFSSCQCKQTAIPSVRKHRPARGAVMPLSKRNEYLLI